MLGRQKQLWLTNQQGHGQLLQLNHFAIDVISAAAERAARHTERHFMTALAIPSQCRLRISLPPLQHSEGCNVYSRQCLTTIVACFFGGDGSLALYISGSRAVVLEVLLPTGAYLANYT